MKIKKLIKQSIYSEYALVFVCYSVLLTILYENYNLH